MKQYKLQKRATYSYINYKGKVNIVTEYYVFKNAEEKFFDKFNINLAGKGLIRAIFYLPMLLKRLVEKIQV